MWITRVSINNPVFATMVMVGAHRARRLLVQPAARRADARRHAAVRLIVRRAYPGASPEAVETDVTKPIEDAVNTVAGVQARSARTRCEGRSEVFVEFRLDTDIDAARCRTCATRSRRCGRGFPRDVKDPLVVRADSENEQPVVVARRDCRRRRSLRELTSLTDQTIVKALENVPGVARSTSTAA